MTITLTLPTGTALTIDPWAANPLLDGWSARNPELVKAALAEAPAPTLFVTGDLPPFTASGIDPHFLSYLPFGCRHYSATEPVAANVLALIERSSSDPDASIDSEGLNDYLGRFDNWITGRLIPPSQHDDAAQAGVYDGLFGARDAALNDRLTAQKAFADEFNARRNPFAAGDPATLQMPAGKSGYGIRLPGGR